MISTTTLASIIISGNNHSSSSLPLALAKYNSLNSAPSMLLCSCCINTARPPCGRPRKHTPDRWHERRSINTLGERAAPSMIGWHTIIHPDQERCAEEDTSLNAVPSMIIVTLYVVFIHISLPINSSSTIITTADDTSSSSISIRASRPEEGEPVDGWPPQWKRLQRSVLRRAPRAKLRLGWVVGNCDGDKTYDSR
eukprot:scaffold42022_cov212-Skeletonema_marinoi.AAC.1